MTHPHPVVAKNLRAALVEQGWTQERLAREIDVSYSAVQSWCLGKTRPHYYNLRRVAKALGRDRDPYWFFTDHDESAAA